MKSLNPKRILYLTFVFSTFAFAIFLLYGLSQGSDWHDFDVFYNAASAVLNGKSIYSTSGPYNLPFWYLPWTAWLYIPYAIWPKNIGIFLYQITSVISGVLTVHFLTNYYMTDFKLMNKVFIFTFIILMSLQLILVGQMDFIFLGLVMIIVWGAEHKKSTMVGLLYPLLLTKPHLIIPFTIILFWRLGKRALLVSSLTSIVMVFIETVITSNWYLEMLHLLQEAGQRTDGLPFTTFPSLFGRQENWIGTANLPFSIIFIILSTIIVWRFRTLSTVPLLSLALALSLFCAPRAYAYDLPLLIPAMVWLTSEKFQSTAWIWIIGALIPIITGFSSATYLVTLLVCFMGIRKATLETNRSIVLSGNT